MNFKESIHLYAMDLKFYYGEVKVQVQLKAIYVYY